MIKLLEIKNFKIHKELSIRIGNGTTVFVAPNGAGKTTIAEAIAWCLFGPTAIRASQERIISEGADECSVVLTILLKGEDHEFVRTYRRNGGSTATCYRGGVIVGSGPKGVADYLSDFGIDLDGFKMIYAQQGELSYFVNAPPAARKQLLTSLLRLDELDETIKTIRKDVRLQEERLEDVPEREEIEDFLADISEMERVESELERQEMELENAIEELQGEETALKDLVVGQLKTVGERAELNTQLQIKEAELGTIYEAIEHYEEIVERELIRPEKELKAVSVAVDTAATLLEELQQESAKDEGVAYAYDSIYDSLECGQNCPICLREIENLEEIRKRLEKRSEIEELALQTQYRELKKAKDDFLNLKREESEVLNAWTEYDRQQHEIEDAVGRLGGLGAKKGDVEFEIRKIRQEMEELPEIDESTQEDWDEVQDALGRALKEKTDVVSERRTCQYRIERMQETAQEYSDRLSGNEMQRAKLATLRDLSKIMPDFRDIVLAQSLGWVAGRASALLYSATQNSWPLSIDTDLNFFVGERPLEDFSSGQVDMVSVCLRIAVAEFLSKRIGIQGLMILDGVFDRIDIDNRDAIGRLVGEINIPQILLLSHFDVPVIEGEKMEIRK
jgi:DNA repair exonuclease SbcCD ATPase subunit